MLNRTYSERVRSIISNTKYFGIFSSPRLFVFSRMKSASSLIIWPSFTVPSFITMRTKRSDAVALSLSALVCAKPDCGTLAQMVKAINAATRRSGNGFMNLGLCKYNDGQVNRSMLSVKHQRNTLIQPFCVSVLTEIPSSVPHL